MADNDNKTHAQRVEESAVRRLGEAIGYGNVMQLAGQLWGEALVLRGHPPGGQFALGPCVAFMVACPCPDDGRDANGHCEWCCGSRQVTERVRAAMGRPRAVPAPVPASAPGWRKAPPTVEEVEACSWWWHRAHGVEPRVRWLEVQDGYDMEPCVVVRIPHVLGLSLSLDRASDAEWALCLPPGEGGRTP